MNESGGAILKCFKCVDKIYLVWTPGCGCLLKFGSDKRFLGTLGKTLQVCTNRFIRCESKNTEIAFVFY